jgi:hypothetical protein
VTCGTTDLRDSGRRPPRYELNGNEDIRIHMEHYFWLFDRNNLKHNVKHKLDGVIFRSSLPRITLIRHKGSTFIDSALANNLDADSQGAKE